MPHCDYFSYTFKGLQIDEDTFSKDYVFLVNVMFPEPVARHLLEKNIERVVEKFGKFGYKTFMYYPNIGISVFTNGHHPDLGIHVVLSGTCLKLFKAGRDFFCKFKDSIDNRCNKLQQHYYSDVFGCPDVQFNISRFDVAYDFDTPFCEFYDKFKSDCFLSRMKNCTTQLNSKNQGTIYLGRRDGGCFIRIYDKTLEQQQKQLKIFGGHPFDVKENWTRLEFEFKNDYKRKSLPMQAFICYCSSDEDIGALCIGFLRITVRPRVGRENYDSIELWEPYKVIILSNCKLDVDYYDSYYSASLNLVYMQQIASYLITACRSVPGLSDFLIRTFRWSDNAENRSKNYYIDWDKLKFLSDKPRSISSNLDFESDEELSEYFNYLVSLHKEKVSK